MKIIKNGLIALTIAASLLGGCKQKEDPKTHTVKIREYGSETAPVKMDAWIGYAEPFSKEWYDNTLPDIMFHYVNQDKVRLRLRDFPINSINAQANEAALAAREAGILGRHDSLMDKLFMNQSTWNNDASSDPLYNIASQYNVKPNTPNRAEHQKGIDQDVLDATNKGINGVPAFELTSKNGTEIIQGSQPYDTFKTAFENHLK